MIRTLTTVLLAVILATLLVGCEPMEKKLPGDQIVGAWRARVQFSTGPYASVKDLDFMYVFNVGGTMTESSNYDAAPPVTPAYGVWRQIDGKRFEAKYEFYITRPPDSLEVKSGAIGWLPGGRGILTDTLTLAEDGNSFNSTTDFRSFDLAGKEGAEGGRATGQGTRIGF